MVSWLRRGMPIPLHIHIVAIVLTLAGFVCLALMLIGGWFDWRWDRSFSHTGPAIYFGWLWLFGPEFSRQASKSVAPETENLPKT